MDEEAQKTLVKCLKAMEIAKDTPRENDQAMIYSHSMIMSAIKEAEELLERENDVSTEH